MFSAAMDATMLKPASELGTYLEALIPAAPEQKPWYVLPVDVAEQYFGLGQAVEPPRPFGYHIWGWAAIVSDDAPKGTISLVQVNSLNEVELLGKIENVKP